MTPLAPSLLLLAVSGLYADIQITTRVVPRCAEERIVWNRTVLFCFHPYGRWTD